MLGGIFEKNNIKNKIQKFNQEITNENFWKNKLKAQKIIQESEPDQQLITHQELVAIQVLWNRDFIFFY